MKMVISHHWDSAIMFYLLLSMFPIGGLLIGLGLYEMANQKGNAPDFPIKIKIDEKQ